MHALLSTCFLRSHLIERINFTASHGSAEELWVGLDCGENRSHEKTREKWKMMVPNFVFLRTFGFSALKAVKYREGKKEVASMIQYLRTMPVKLVSRVLRVNRSVVERPRTFPHAHFSSRHPRMWKPFGTTSWSTSKNLSLVIALQFLASYFSWVSNSVQPTNFHDNNVYPLSILQKFFVVVLIYLRLYT